MASPIPTDLGALGRSLVVMPADADVARTRERGRRRRWIKLGILLVLLCGFLWLRLLGGSPVHPGVPSLPSGLQPYLPGFFLVLLFGGAIIAPMVGMGRSPHVLYRASEIDVRLSDVKGADVVVDEVVKTLNLFLAHRTFKERMGGTARRGILFEGPPGTGKTYLAKAMAAEAGVPFLFVSSSAFQSMYFGQTNRKIRSFFKALRKAARNEGGAIGFIEEIDAIGGARSGMGGGGSREGISGVVNELLIQLQSFDEPPPGARLKGKLLDAANRWLPVGHQFKKRATTPANILVIGATNRAADLDPALLRPGRFDRSIYFDLPSRTGRREILDYYLGKKSHDEELDEPTRRDTLAAMTVGYSPVMLEHLLDEALVWALRRGAECLSWADLQAAKMTAEIGLAQPVEYTEAERRTIATHESGHATVAWLVGKGRRLEVLSIIKRRDALGLLAHSDTEERYTRTRTELISLIQIAFGGMVAEELFFGEAGTGPSGDLEAATLAAAQMVGSFGMAHSLISYDAMSGPPGANIVAKVLSDDSGRAALDRILNNAKTAVTQMLDAHRPVVEALRDALLERDELVGEEIEEVIRSAGASPVTLSELAGLVAAAGPSDTWGMPQADRRRAEEAWNGIERRSDGRPRRGSSGRRHEGIDRRQSEADPRASQPGALAASPAGDPSSEPVGDASSESVEAAAPASHPVADPSSGPIEAPVANLVDAPGTETFGAQAPGPVEASLSLPNAFGATASLEASESPPVLSPSSAPAPPSPPAPVQ